VLRCGTFARKQFNQRIRTPEDAAGRSGTVIGLGLIGGHELAMTMLARNPAPHVLHTDF